MNRLKKHFEHVTRHDLIIKDHLINSMQVPYLNKLVLNIGLGSKLILNRKEIVTSLLALELISSQRASMTRARKSIDKFKLKKRMVIGSKVTLRKKKMFFFLDKLITEVLPNLENLEEFNKNYKRSLNQNIKKNKTHRQRLGLRKNKSWNMGFGLEDFFSFKEIPYDKFDKSHGLDLSFSLKQGYKLGSSKEKVHHTGVNNKKVVKISFRLGRISENNKQIHSDHINSKGLELIQNPKNQGPFPYNYALSSFQLPLS